MPQIAWRKEYEIGIGGIDDQHKTLFGLLSKVDSNRLKEDKIPVLKEVLFQLVDYTNTHFKDEEEFMMMIQYPKLLEHKSQHHTLVNQVVEIIKKIKEGKYNINDEVMSLLKKWVLNHIMDHDKQIGEFFSTKQKVSIFVKGT